MARPDPAALRRHFVAWTVLTIGSETSMLWGLLSVDNVSSSIGINVGFFGLLAVALGATRRVPMSLRVGPVLIGTALFGVWPAARWIFRQDLDTASAAISVGIFLATMVAIVGTLVFLSRRGLIVDTRVRQALTLLLVVLLSVSALVSFPTGVWKGRMGLGALVAQFLILLWPARRSGRPAAVPHVLDDHRHDGDDHDADRHE